ncbi:MAG TPA: fibronectin type III domain-containing protein, partial [Patescibacteria group bacterium]
MKNVLERKMPTALGIILILGTIIGTTFLVKTGVIYLGGAAPSDNPKNVRISNISDSSLTVSYNTDAAVIGTVSIGKDKNSLETILDERDQKSGTPQQYKLHSITIQNLSPNTQYVFSITSGATTYLNNNSFFTTKTAPTLSTSPTSQPPLTGSIVSPDGTAPQEALVYLTTNKGQLLSTLTKPSGIYTIPLN